MTSHWVREPMFHIDQFGLQTEPAGSAAPTGVLKAEPHWIAAALPPNETSR